MADKAKGSLLWKAADKSPHPFIQSGVSSKGSSLCETFDPKACAASVWTGRRIGPTSVVARTGPVRCFAHGGHSPWPQVVPDGWTAAGLASQEPASFAPDSPLPLAQVWPGSWPAVTAPTAVPSRAGHWWQGEQKVVSAWRTPLWTMGLAPAMGQHWWARHSGTSAQSWLGLLCQVVRLSDWAGHPGMWWLLGHAASAVHYMGGQSVLGSTTSNHLEHGARVGAVCSPIHCSARSWLCLCGLIQTAKDRRQRFCGFQEPDRRRLVWCCGTPAESDLWQLEVHTSYLPWQVQCSALRILLYGRPRQSPNEAATPPGKHHWVSDHLRFWARQRPRAPHWFLTPVLPTSWRNGSWQQSEKLCPIWQVGQLRSGTADGKHPTELHGGRSPGGANPDMCRLSPDGKCEDKA